MNRNLLVAAVVLLVAGVLGFVFNVPVAGWILLVVGLLVLIGSFVRGGTPLPSTATTNLDPNRNTIEAFPNQGAVDYAAPTLGTPGPVNPGAPVNAGPPHVPESRDDPFDNNGPLSAS